MAAADDDAQISTLKAMFDAWDEATLAKVLAASGGSMDRAAEAVLTAGAPEAWRAARARSAAPRSPPAGAAPPGAVSVVVPPGSRGGATLSMTAHGRSFMVTVPPGLRAGDRFVATIPPPRGAAVTPHGASPLRGKRVALPDDFLRPPPTARSGTEATNQQAALFLQHENRRRAAAAAPRPAGAPARAFPSFSRSSSRPASSGGYSGVLNSAATRAAAAAKRAAASAGRGASALKEKVKRAAGGSDRVEIAEQRYGQLNLNDELDDTDDANPLHRDPDLSPPAPRPQAGTDFREVGNGV